MLADRPFGSQVMYLFVYFCYVGRSVSFVGDVLVVVFLIMLAGLSFG